MESRPSLPQRRLTPRSSGAPTAGHQARSGGTRYIFASPGLASHRWCRLNSNVRHHKRSPPMTVAILLTSSRSAGNTRTLVDLAFPAGRFALEDLRSLNLGFYSYENENEADDFLPLIRRMMNHHTWIIATPLYWYSMSAQAKQFLDRLSDLLAWHKEQGRLLRGKKLAVLCSGTDPDAPESFSEPFKLTCEYLGMEFLGTHYAQFQGLYPARPSAGRDAESFARTVAPSAA